MQKKSVVPYQRKLMRTERRQFLKMLTFGTVTSMVSGKLWQREVLAFCSPTSQKEAVFQVRVSDFPALQEDFGSIRLGINPVFPDQEPFPDGNFWPFLINRDDLGNFYILDCECRHQSCVVPTYDPGIPGIQCPCHGSLYDIDGALLGGPANQPLHSYPFEFDGVDTLSIRIPCWGFETKLAVLPGGPNPRARLDFETFPQVTYEVSFHEHADDPWSLVSFATAPDGTTDQTSVVGTGGSLSIYLDRTTPTGFYAIDMELAEV